MSEERHILEVTFNVTNAEGKKTAWATIGLGEMKLEDVVTTEAKMLEIIPKAFLDLLKQSKMDYVL